MASVFLSYDREDLAPARAIALALEKAGHSVWWDRHIKGGAEYGREIEAALDQSDAVVVLWSGQSVASAWVRDEAAAGRDKGCLIPVLLEAVNPPLGFRQYQNLDFSDWKGRGKPPGLPELLDSIKSLRDLSVGHHRSSPKAIRKSQSWKKWRSLNLWWVIGAALVLAGLLIARPWAVAASGPTVTVEPADASADARALARELLVRLGTERSGRTSQLQLLEADAKDDPDLLLQVSGTLSAQPAAATLALVRARDRQLLFSEALTPPAGEKADLKLSAAVAATAMLECAAESLTHRPHLRLDLLKLYVGACVRFSALYGHEDVSILIPQLEQVVQREPRFLPARKQLLMAGAFIRSIPTDLPKPSEQWLRAQIDAARRFYSEMPELKLAELQLFQTTDFARRLHLLDQLRQQFPENIFVLGALAEQLMQVGRNNDAVVEAERAARLAQLAPYSRSEYIRALAFSGLIPRAFEELNNFSPLSPIAMSLTDTKFRLNMRYGDPQQALKSLRMHGTSKSHEAFLMARIEPTPQNTERSLGISRSIAAERGYYAAHSEVLEAFGRSDEAFQMLMQVPPATVDQFTLQTLFRPTLSKLRQDPRFLRIAQRFGLLVYWEKSGHWPDFCSEPDLPYDCKAEAAKLN